MSVDIQYKIIWFLSTGLITNTLSGSMGNSEFHFPSISMFPEAARETLRSRGNKTHCFPRDQSLSVIPPNLKLEKTAKKSFALCRLPHKFAAISRSTIT